jgi:membrane-bound metal-dependent hydrolase YbcI (DUF457 family)
MGVVWGIGLAAIARSRGVSATGAWVIAALVVSHWVLDFITHRPDMPLWPWPDGKYGLGLWQSIPATLAIESLMWITSIAVFLGVRRLRGGQGQLSFWSFVAVSTVLWATSPFSPPPPGESALIAFALFGWVIVPWAWWIERTSGPR